MTSPGAEEKVNTEKDLGNSEEALAPVVRLIFFIVIKYT